ncbi:MAG TPA: DUF721 domain-containing protein [Candidatus Eisenbacteria bacterium]
MNRSAPGPRRPGGSRPSRGGAFRPIASVLDEVLAGLELETRFHAAQATDLWSEIVGPDVGRRTRAVGVRDRELMVEVQGAVWMGHLAVLRQGILDDLNGRLPAESRLRSIRLVPMRCKEERVEPER